MAEEYRYTGPENGVDAKARLRARAARFVRRRAEQIYLELVWAWAEADTGDYPRRSDAEQDAVEELEVLLRGIGQWGLVDPDALPRGRRQGPPRGFDLPDWEWDLLE